MLILYALFLHTNTSTGAVSLNRESCLTQERSRRCNPDPGVSGISAFAGNMPLFISEWEGWQRSGEPEDLPVNRSE